MIFIIDRFEGDYAICEDEKGEMHDIEKIRIPKEAKEGDILVVYGDDIIIDEERTKKQKRGMEDLIEELWED